MDVLLKIYKMAHTNRYYIVASNDPNLNDIIGVSVGELATQRYSIDEQKIVVKLNRHDHNEYSFLSQYTEYNHEQILSIMNTPEWVGEI
jgi:hypothetical protein